jgi:hypothetical protein
MPKFGEFSDEDLEALRHYIAQRARELAAERAAGVARP